MLLERSLRRRMDYFGAKKTRQFRSALLRSDKAIGAVDESVTRGPLMASIQPHNQVIVLSIVSPALGYSNCALVKSD